MLLTVSGIQVHYEIVGDSPKGESNPAVLLLHGWGGSHKSLMSLAEGLQESCSCYLIDLPGFGRSSDPPSTWGVDEYTEFLKTFIDKVGVAVPISVIGHSFGGALALALAAKYPEVVSQLVVCAPSWHRMNMSDKTKPPRPVSRILHKFPIVRKILYKVLFPKSDIMQKPQLEENFKRIVQQDLTNVVKSVHQNTLILWGKEDTYVPVTDASLLHEHIHHSILSVFPGLGHDLPIRHSELISPSVHTFLTTKTLA